MIWLNHGYVVRTICTCGLCPIGQVDIVELDLALAFGSGASSSSEQEEEGEQENGDSGDGSNHDARNGAA
jgi:hypothetical protein